jgi:signal transduction histidine kinase
MAPARILVVEDEGSVAHDIQRCLARLGYEACGAADTAEEAVRLAATCRPDLVLMDIRLRGARDGIAAAEQIRQKFRVPVVYLTAHADEATLQRARTTEPSGYILKPFEERELRTVIELALYKRQAEAERQRLEEQLRQAQKMQTIGQLAGGVAHDFNNLMTVVLGYASVLMQNAGPGHPWYGMLREISLAAERAADLTRQLLAFSRKSMLQLRVLDLNAVLADVASLLRRLIGEPVELVTRLAPDLPPITADRRQLEQVVLNLATNARDAMAGGGTLVLATSKVVFGEADVLTRPETRPGPYVCLTVEDTGCGMDEATRSRLFEPFFTTKEQGKGTGLGLATVYGIVKQTGGHVEVESSPGRGTTFRVYLPADAGATAAPAGASPVGELVPGRGTVLLVEDEPGVRALARDVLRHSGYTVLEARHGVEALELSRAFEGPIDLLVTDVIMPQMGGPQLADHLRRERPGIRVLCLSGYADRAEPSTSLGCKGTLLTKPFSAAELTRAVRDVLGAPASS